MPKIIYLCKYSVIFAIPSQIRDVCGKMYHCCTAHNSPLHTGEHLFIRVRVVRSAISERIWWIVFMVCTLCHSWSKRNPRFKSISAAPDRRLRSTKSCTVEVWYQQERLNMPFTSSSSHSTRRRLTFADMRTYRMRTFFSWQMACRPSLRSGKRPRVSDAELCQARK